LQTRATAIFLIPAHLTGCGKTRDFACFPSSLAGSSVFSG
jgi:hypothetical protein